MPEIPEAEVAKKTLIPCVVGKTIEQVLVARRQSIRTPLEDDVTFTLELRHKKVKDIERRAKALLFIMDGENDVLFHFKLGADVLCLATHVSETVGVAWNFSDGTALEFSNLALSEFHLVPADELEHLPVVKSGIDPLSRSLTPAALKKALPPGKQIKAAITDQDRISGIGNTYADEILWNARICPFRKVSDLSEAEWPELVRQIKGTLREGIRAGGEEGFVDARGRHGRYHTKIHKRGGQPCPRDGHPIEMVKKGRSTFWCPHCQV